MRSDSDRCRLVQSDACRKRESFSEFFASTGRSQVRGLHAHTVHTVHRNAVQYFRRRPADCGIQASRVASRSRRVHPVARRRGDQTRFKWCRFHVLLWVLQLPSNVVPGDSHLHHCQVPLVAVGTPDFSNVGVYLSTNVNWRRRRGRSPAQHEMVISTSKRYTGTRRPRGIAANVRHVQHLRIISSCAARGAQVSRPSQGTR